MTYTFLRGRMAVYRSDEYDESNELDTVTVNGVPMTTKEFQETHPSKRRWRGMGISSKDEIIED